MCFLAQVLEKNKEHGSLVALCDVLQEEIPLDSTGRTCRYVCTRTPGFILSLFVAIPFFNLRLILFLHQCIKLMVKRCFLQLLHILSVSFSAGSFKAGANGRILKVRRPEVFCFDLSPKCKTLLFFYRNTVNASSAVCLCS